MARMLLITAGTHGDVFPFVALGTRLRRRGHDVTLVTAEPYRQVAHEEGLGFEALMSADELHDLTGNPDVWHPVKSGFVGARWGRRSIAKHYRLLAGLAKDPATVLIAYPPVFAARLIQEKSGRSLISVVTMPWMIPSASAPPRLSIGLNLPAGAPAWLRRIFWAAMHRTGDMLVGRPLNRFRLTLGLPKLRRVFRWWYSPQRVITLFPDWFAPPGADWPQNLSMAGFPLYSGGNGHSLPPDLKKFCASEKPVVFTFGSENMHAREVFAAAVEACVRLRMPGLLVTKFREQVPAELPLAVRHCAYAPFNELFPMVRAVVHHGGIGTTAQALAAGTPQLLLPMAWDQPDNAARVERLGAGIRMGRRRTGHELALSLEKLLDPQMKARCQEIARRFEKADPLETAAKWVEESCARQESQHPKPAA